MPGNLFSHKIPPIHNNVPLTNNLQLVNGAHILYIYTDEALYIDNAVSFISTALKLGQGIVFNDDEARCKRVLGKLQKKGFPESLLETIIFGNHKDFYMGDADFHVASVLKKFTAMVQPFIDQGIPLRTWGNVVWKEPKSLLEKLKTYEQQAENFIEKNQTLSVCAYDGNSLASNIQMELMKTHQYIMTDKELYFSSLYYKAFQAPSIYIQENLEEALFQLEQYKQEVQRLERFQMMSQMAASISHEVRNPLTTVKGFLQLFKDREQYKEDGIFLDLMIEELDRANSIISEFLSLGKTKTPELKVQSLNKIIENIVPLIQATAVETSKYVDLQLEDIPDLPLDHKSIRQVLLNLTQNALEAMSDGGKVTICTYLESGYIVLTIKDEGCGIDRDTIEKLGTPFVTTKDHGTGLGLAISYNILERHGAKIDVQTGPEGTKFYIRFPVG